MYKKLACILLFSFFIIGAVSAADDFIMNDGYEKISDSFYANENNNVEFCIWDYDDEMLQEVYLQNNTDYKIVPGDNNTYNTTFNGVGTEKTVLSYLSNESIPLDHGILEIAEVKGLELPRLWRSRGFLLHGLILSIECRITVLSPLSQRFSVSSIKSINPCFLMFFAAFVSLSCVF